LFRQQPPHGEPGGFSRVDPPARDGIDEVSRMNEMGPPTTAAVLIRMRPRGWIKHVYDKRRDGLWNDAVLISIESVVAARFWVMQVVVEIVRSRLRAPALPRISRAG